MLTQAEKAVVAVLAYSAQFDHPLTVEEICHRLLTNEGLRVIDAHFSEKSSVFSGPFQANRARIEKILQQLVRKKVCSRQGKWYTITASNAAFLKRQTGEKVQREKAAVLAEFTALLQKVPWVLGAAVTGSHAAGGARPEDDVDLFVIIERNRMWLARLLLLFVSWQHGRRPHLPGGDISHSWDLNLWLDETRLSLPPHKRTVYEAYEIVQTHWIFDRKNTRARFFDMNAWVKKYLLFGPKEGARSLSKVYSYQSGFFDWLNWLDWLAFGVQIGYRTLRHGFQKAEKHSAFFHQSGTKDAILSAWKKWYTQAVR